MFGKGLLQGRFPRRELFLPLQVFQRVEARFFDAFQGGRQRAVNEVKVAAVAVADEGGVDEAGEVRFDVAFDGGLFEAVQLLFGVAVGGEDARQFGGEFAGRRDEFALAARERRLRAVRVRGTPSCRQTCASRRAMMSSARVLSLPILR